MQNSIATAQDLSFEKLLKFSRLNKSGTTKKNYYYNLIDFVKFLLGENFKNSNKDELVKQTLSIALQEGQVPFQLKVIEYIEFLQQKNQSNRTINAKIYAIKNYINFCKQIQIINWDLSIIKGLKIEKSDVEGPSPQKFEKILYYVNTLWNFPDYISKRNALLFYILVFCGLRESEVISIKIEDINFENATIKTSKKGYTKLKETSVPNSTLEKIKQFVELDSRRKGYLFIGKSELKPSIKLDRSSVWRIIKKICKHCGFEKYHPHSFRHFIVAEALEVTNHNTRLSMKFTGHKSEKVFNDYEDKRENFQGVIANKIEEKWLKGDIAQFAPMNFAHDKSAQCASDADGMGEVGPKN